MTSQGFLTSTSLLEGLQINTLHNAQIFTWWYKSQSCWRAKWEWKVWPSSCYPHSWRGGSFKEKTPDEVVLWKYSCPSLPQWKHSDTVSISMKTPLTHVGVSCPKTYLERSVIITTNTTNTTTTITTTSSDNFSGVCSWCDLSTSRGCHRLSQTLLRVLQLCNDTVRGI